MKLLLDSDAFCKLGIAGLLEPAVRSLGCELAECGRLPALPRMLRRGGLRDRIGDVHAAALKPLAESVPEAPAPAARWLDPLLGIAGIDPGEVQLFAATAEHGLLLVSGDKRAMGALRACPAILPALAGRVVVLETMLIELCDVLGVDVVRAQIAPTLAIDTALRVAFGSQRESPVVLLRKYFANLLANAPPEIFWLPTSMRPPA